MAILCYIFGSVFSSEIETMVIRSPVRKLLMFCLSQLKHGKGPVVAQTLFATVSVLFLSSLYGLYNFNRQVADAAAINPTEQVLMVNYLLEATLLGISLFLALVIDRLHYYIDEIRRLRKKTEDYQLYAQKGKETLN